MRLTLSLGGSALLVVVVHPDEYDCVVLVYASIVWIISQNMPKIPIIMVQTQTSLIYYSRHQQINVFVIDTGPRIGPANGVLGMDNAGGMASPQMKHRCRHWDSWHSSIGERGALGVVLQGVFSGFRGFRKRVPRMRCEDIYIRNPTSLYRTLCPFVDPCRQQIRVCKEASHKSTSIIVVMTTRNIDWTKSAYKM